MKKFFVRMFSEPSGKPSSTRFFAAFVCVIVLGVWAFTSLKKGEMQRIEESQAALIVGAMGVRAWQRGKEVQSPSPSVQAGS